MHVQRVLVCFHYKDDTEFYMTHCVIFVSLLIELLRNVIYDFIVNLVYAIIVNA